MTLPPQKEDAFLYFNSHMNEVRAATKQVADVLSSYTSHNPEDTEYAASELARLVVGLRRVKQRKKPPGSSRDRIQKLSKTLHALSEILGDIEATPEVYDTLHWEIFSSVYREQAARLPVSGVFTRHDCRHIVLNNDDIPEGWDDEASFDSSSYVALLPAEDRDAFRRHVGIEHTCLLRDFHEVIAMYQEALTSEAVLKIGGQGQKRDIPVDGFIYRVASVSLHYLPDEFRISDSPSSPFFRLLDQLLVLAGIERSDRTIRDRIANFVYETRADKWWKKD